MTLHNKLLEIQNLGLKFGKTASNPFYKSKYLTLDHLLDKLLPELNKLEILVWHYTENNEVVTAISDGETVMTSKFPIGNVSDPQKIGSAITYAKRYNLGQLFNIVTDDDDDGNKASVKDDEEYKELVDGKPVYKKKHIDELGKNMKNFPGTYTMTLEKLIADKEKNFYVSDAMKDSIKELYDRLPRKETPEEVATTAAEAFPD